MASVGWTKTDDEPIDEKVEEIFEAIWPLLPNPEIITLPLVLKSKFIAFEKFLLRQFFKNF